MSRLQCHIELNYSDKLCDMPYQFKQAVVGKVGLFAQAIDIARRTLTCRRERILLF